MDEMALPDEIAPYRSRNGFDLGMTGYVNGELVSEGRWDSIDWGFPDMITYTSRGPVFMQLYGQA
jgi:2-keto-4-pentenoate hydratase/2-oxohepta-3-ene-1,7-dioic acid hydratase in catechol pathway